MGGATGRAAPELGPPSLSLAKTFTAEVIGMRPMTQGVWQGLGLMQITGRVRLAGIAPAFCGVDPEEGKAEDRPNPAPAGTEAKGES